jgi:D-serine deaminase-like pyridoxal phosphate-dependent protein
MLARVKVRDLPTPALVVDARGLERNLDADVIDRWPVDLRGW